MIQVQDQARAIRNLQDSVLPMKIQLAETTGIFKRKERLFLYSWKSLLWSW